MGEPDTQKIVFCPVCRAAAGTVAWHRDQDVGMRCPVCQVSFMVSKGGSEDVSALRVPDGDDYMCGMQVSGEDASL